MPIDTTKPIAGTLLTRWTSSPIPDLLIALAVIGYLALVISHHRRGCSWPRTRIVCWLAAAALLVLAMNSALAVYAQELFWVHMIVHLLLIMVVPALAVEAQPIRLLHDACGPRAHHAVERARHRWPCRVLISPP